jgi:sugar phosphate isomerase/epimerase
MKDKQPVILASVLDFNQGVCDRFNDLGIGVELSALSLPQNLEAGILEPLIKQTQEVLKNLKGVCTMHGAFFNLQIMARDPWIVEVCKKRMLQSLEIADRLGAKRLVFHANYPPNKNPKHRQNFIDAQLRYWPELIRKAESYNIKMLLENTQEPDPSYLYEVLSQLDSPYLKACYDTGHSNCFTHTKIPPHQWVEGLGEELTYLHLHDNHGERDDHIAFTDGNQDFELFFPALEALPEYPWINIEVKTKEAFARSIEGLKALKLLS